MKVGHWVELPGKTLWVLLCHFCCLDVMAGTPAATLDHEVILRTEILG